jgi:type IV secretory pathway protease TraF
MSRTGRILLVTSLLIVALIASTATISGGDLLLYNPSNSIPSGLYVRTNHPVELGRMVTVRANDVSPLYATLRNFDDPDDRFIKRVIAGRGQVVCAEGAAISIDGRIVAQRLERDDLGRALPSWTGCRTLGDQVLLLGDTPDSFDGRYWGPTPASMIEGVWVRLAAFRAS